MALALPPLPVTEPILFFAIATLLFLIVPVVFERVRVPGLIGLIVAGAAIGPKGAGIFGRGEAMQLLGTGGLLYLMFLVGLELDLEQFRRHRHHSLLFGLTSFIVPLVAGAGIALVLGYRWLAAALLGATLASHTPVGYPVASRLGILKTPAVTMVLGGTLITDMLALLALAVVTGARAGSAMAVSWLHVLAALAVYSALVIGLVPRLARWFFRRFGSDSALDFPFAIAVLFSSCAVAERAGIEPIIGALLTGLALNRFIPEQSALMSRIRFAASNLFVPFFLVSVGMLVDFTAFERRAAWNAILALTAGVVIAKVIAAKLAERVFHFAPEDGWVVFGLSVSRAAATIAIVLVGYDIKLFDEAVVNAVVVIILVTCILGPWAVGRWGRAVALREEQAVPASATPARILVPIANPATRDALLDLAILLRPPGSDEPLLPLMVVREEGAETEANVARAERMLAQALLRAASASVPVAAMTRVDHNIASGIARGVTERRASTVVIGWDGRAAAPAAVFGSVLDQLLAKTRASVVVARLAGSLNAIQRVLLVLPPFANRDPGFSGALRTVKLLANQLTAKLVVRIVADAPAPFERVIAAIKPDVATQFLPPTTWQALTRSVSRMLGRHDLVVLIGAREGTLTWHPRLARLPRVLAASARQVPLLVIYPGEPAEEERTLTPEASALDEYLAPSRVSADLPDDPHEAIRHLVDLELHDAPELRDRVIAALARELGDSHELRPGIALPHARVEGVTRPILFLGRSRAGVQLPGDRRPAHLVFVLLSPAGSPDQHLRALSAVARACMDDARLETLLRRHGIDLPPRQ